jgi:hypothetical protein
MSYRIQPASNDGIGWIGPVISGAVSALSAAATTVATTRMQMIDNQRSRSKQEDLARSEGALARQQEAELAKVQERLQAQAIDRAAGIGPDGNAIPVASAASGDAGNRNAMLIGAVVLAVAVAIGAAYLIRRRMAKPVTAAAVAK